MTAYLAADKDGTECIYAGKKHFLGKEKWGPDLCDYLSNEAFYDFVELPPGSIKKPIGRELYWSDETVKPK